METGFVLDRNRFEDRQGTWVEGTFERNVWTGGVKAVEKEQIPITTHRCGACGYLESYAMPDLM
ncbi:MAG: hypothetical protein ABIS29_16070 [Vicinamibacterales bacterium]